MADHGCVYPAVTFYGTNRSVSIEEVLCMHYEFLIPTGLIYFKNCIRLLPTRIQYHMTNSVTIAFKFDWMSQLSTCLVLVFCNGGAVYLPQ